MMKPKEKFPLEYTFWFSQNAKILRLNEKRAYIWWSLKIQILGYIDVPRFWLDAKDISCISTSYCVSESVSYKTTTKHIKLDFWSTA